MKIEVNDKSLMMILLLEECNFECAHCIREDEPMDHGYKLSFKQLQLCLSDCRNLESISWVHFSGGEPTLWTESNRNLVDLLLEIAKAGLTPGFTSNGSFFVDYKRCHDFFGKYFDNSNMPLRLYLSIDTFHRNFNAMKRRARCLDNVIEYKRQLPPAKARQFDISVLVAISTEAESLLPDEMIRHYESLGVVFIYVPLHLMGKAKSLSHLCPDLDSGNPEDLGVFQRFYSDEKRKNRDRAISKNIEAHINLIGNEYYFARQWRKVGRLGHLPDTIIRAYSDVAGA